MEDSVMVAPAVLEVEGCIENGRIVLDDPLVWPEGTRLHLRVMTESDAEAEKKRLERLLALAGSCPDLERPPQLELEVREPLE